MSKKKTLRKNFRDSVFSRDGFRCVICGVSTNPEKVESFLDAHHITPREEFPNGGYVVENGISLCDPSKNGGDFTKGCHFQAEMFLKGESLDSNFSPSSLYKRVSSSKEEAQRKDKELGRYISKNS